MITGLLLTFLQAHALLQLEVSPGVRLISPTLLNQHAKISEVSDNSENDGDVANEVWEKLDNEDTFSTKVELMAQLNWMFLRFKPMTLYLGPYLNLSLPSSSNITGTTGATSTEVTKSTSHFGVTAGGLVRFAPYETGRWGIFVDAYLGLGKTWVSQSIETSAETHTLSASGTHLESNFLLGGRYAINKAFNIGLKGGYARTLSDSLTVSSKEGTAYETLEEGQRLVVLDEEGNAQGLTVDRSGWLIVFLGTYWL